MPTYKNSQEWLQQSSLLLQARPATVRPFPCSTFQVLQTAPTNPCGVARPSTAQTRITTKYSIKDVKPRKSKADGEQDSTMPDAVTAKPPRGSLEIKTYDPVSGVALKYRTTKAAEVTRLINLLGSLGRTMATSKAPAEVKDEAVADTPAEEKGVGAAELKSGAQEKPQQAAGGSGGKKKKKGKK